MALSIVNTYFDNNTSSLNTSTTVAAVSANAGDTIFFLSYWRAKTPTISAPSWNSQTFTRQGVPIDTGEATLEIYKLIVTTTGTANIVATFSDYVFYNTGVAVIRDSAAPSTITMSAITQQIFISGTYTNPSITQTSVPSGALALDILAAMGWDLNYDNVTATTWTPTATNRSGIVNSGHQAINSLSFSSAVGTGTNLTTGWSPSAAQPMYIHFALYFSITATTTIDSITASNVLGGNGAISTTNLATLTSLTIGGKAVSNLSAPNGDGSYSIPLWTDTQQGFLIANGQAVIAGDGTKTATGTTNIVPESGKSFVTLTSVNSTTGYLGAYITLNVGDQVKFPTAASLGVEGNYIDVDGGIYTDFSGSQTLQLRKVSTGLVTDITLITGATSTVPDAFTFNDVPNVALGSLNTSNTITVTGITGSTTITTGGKPYKINNGSYVTANGTVSLNDTVTLQLTASSIYSTPVSTVVNIGGTTDTWTVTTLEALALYSPSTVTEGNAFTATFNKTGTTKHLYLETTDSVRVFEQIVDTWSSTSATGSYLNGNWLQVLNNTLPSGSTDGLPFTSTTQAIRLRLTIDSETATLIQNYLPPSGYTKLDYNSSSSNVTSNSAWYSIGSLVNSDQILVSNIQTANDSTPLTVTWSSDGTPTPSSNLAFNYYVVYLKLSTGKLTRVSRNYVPASAGVIDVNGGLPLHAGDLFTVTVSGLLSTNIHFVQLQIASKVWILPRNATLSNTILNAIAPIDLPVSGSITVSVKEWKSNASGGSTPVSNEIVWVTVPKTASFIADLNFGYFIDTSLVAITMQLPPVPTVGQKVSYLDYTGSFSSFGLTINPNGKRIYGNLENYTTSSVNEGATLIYTGEAQGWKFLNVAPSI